MEVINQCLKVVWLP